MHADLRPHCDPELSALESAVIEQRLSELIRRYVHRRSTNLARAILSHIESLCRHPDFDGNPEQRCVYHRLARHWGWLAHTGPGMPEPR